MKTNTSSIQCPRCGVAININAALFEQLEAQLKEEITAGLADEKKALAARADSITKAEKSIADEKSAIADKIAEGVHAGLKSERRELEQRLRKELMDETERQSRTMQEELNKKSEQLKDYHHLKSEIERLKRANDEIESTLEAKLEARYTQTLQEEKARMKKAQEERASLRIAEKDQVITQLKHQLQLAQRKAEQGSGQLQGEVQELAIEQWLKQQFPLDTIEEIKKGARGADCLQTVNTRSKPNCGLIYYESKRTKHFQPTWIEKFKSDIRDRGAHIGVLVTEVMPSDMERLGLKDGVWICSFEEFKGLCGVLRQSVIQLSNAIASQENKGDKMVMLYNYLTSNEFRLQIEAIVEGFIQMQQDLEAEKRALQSVWKKREKQIQKVLMNTNDMYSSIKGIAGAAIQPVKQLDLPENESE
jgi:hypothetical protein